MLIRFLLHILKISITEDRFFFEEGGIVLSRDLDDKRGLITLEKEIKYIFIKTWLLVNT